jgi:8-oxo-dGTP pyrophosphatase MutT (NUDIX family)
MENNPWQIVDSKQVYDNPWITLTHHDVINPSGNPGMYGAVHFKNRAVGILVVDGQMNTWLIGQYRFVLNGYSWEIPEGGAPCGTDPLEGAKKELLEETGLKAANWQLLMRMHLSNSVTDELALVYLATGLTPGEAEPEETEQLELKKIPFAAAYEMVRNGEITDAISVAAIMKLQLMLAEGFQI